MVQSVNSVQSKFSKAIVRYADRLGWVASVDRDTVNAFLSSTSANAWLPKIQGSSYLNGKIARESEEKSLISSYIANNMIKENETIILDSGTTIAEIPYFLGVNENRVFIHTNNYLITSYNIHPCVKIEMMFDRPVHKDYGATFAHTHQELTATLDAIHCDKTILAAAGITYQDGPLCQKGDEVNRPFKDAIVHKCLQEEGNDLIIAVDWKKFQEKPDSYKLGDILSKSIVSEPVLSKTVWESALERQNFSLVTNFPENPVFGISNDEYQQAENSIKPFKQNEKGMKYKSIMD